MVLVPKWSFFNFSFLSNIGQENVSYDILEQKNTFLGYKNKKFKKSKNCNFSKGVNPWFWSKNGHFFNFFFLGNIGQEHVFYDILERNNAILGYKKRSSKTQKIPIFLRGLTHGFWTKMAIFATSFFQAKQARKMSFTIFQIEKMAFWAIKTRSSKSQKIAIFLKGLPNGFGPKIVVFLIFFFLGNIG